ncbi:MAG: glycosyltransferase N-terminal domain-containing protein [Verrucomicrobiota bacterium]|nr:glycosyltransferase N-terminal domain-containing protein [Verrucomicrobiota bacterium]
MIWLYRVIFLPALLLMLPRFLWRMVKRGGYARDFSQRFGFFPHLPAPTTGIKRVWLQAVSVGEILAIEPLVKSLAQTPGLEVVLTTTTSTGYTLARERLAPHCRAVGIFPVDFWLCSRLAWRRIQPSVALLMEGELWPEHLHQAKKHHAPLLLINARLSDRSFRRYRKLGWAHALTFDRLTRILASTPQDAARFTEVAGASKVILTGNLKCDIEITPRLSPPELQSLRDELGFIGETATIPPSPPLILLGSSTWPGEEIALLETFEAVLAQGIDCRLLIIPRHAERRNEIVALLEKQTRLWHLRSRGQQAPRPVFIYVGDTTGELRKLTQLADLVFVGKSLPPHTEGQTPIEAAVLGKPILFGPGMSNFRDISRGLIDCGAALRVDSPATLTATALRLLSTPAERQRIAAAAVEWHKQNRGALGKMVEAIRAVVR